MIVSLLPLGKVAEQLSVLSPAWMCLKVEFFAAFPHCLQTVCFKVLNPCWVRVKGYYRSGTYSFVTRFYVVVPDQNS